jgi:hypothetical protein
MKQAHVLGLVALALITSGCGGVIGSCLTQVSDVNDQCIQYENDHNVSSTADLESDCSGTWRTAEECSLSAIHGRCEYRSSILNVTTHYTRVYYTTGSTDATAAESACDLLDAVTGTATWTAD